MFFKLTIPRQLSQEGRCEHGGYESGTYVQVGPLNETNTHEDPGLSSELAWHTSALCVLLLP